MQRYAFKKVKYVIEGICKVEGFAKISEVRELVHEINNELGKHNKKDMGKVNYMENIYDGLYGFRNRHFQGSPGYDNIAKILEKHKKIIEECRFEVYEVTEPIYQLHVGNRVKEKSIIKG